MKVLSVVGARPQFMKAAPVGAALAVAHTHLLAHTGQHYNANMSDVFFSELGLPQPDFDLAIGSGSHGEQTGAMLTALERVILEAQPEWVLVRAQVRRCLGVRTALRAQSRRPVAGRQHAECSRSRSGTRGRHEAHRRVP